MVKTGAKGSRKESIYAQSSGQCQFERPDKTLTKVTPGGTAK